MMRFPKFRAATLAVLLVAGCVTDRGAGPSGGADTSSNTVGMGTSGQGAAAAADAVHECAIYRRMMAGKSRAEQQATMQSQMQSMSGRSVASEQVRAERDRMDRACGAAPMNR
jgi:hypothetical protein